LRCLGCGEWITAEVRNITTYRLKCPYCNKSKKLKIKNKLGFSMQYYGPVNDGRLAVAICGKLKENANHNRE
jgi:hypothetical protein